MLPGRAAAHVTGRGDMRRSCLHQPNAAPPAGHLTSLRQTPHGVDVAVDGTHLAGHAACAFTHDVKQPSRGQGRRQPYQSPASPNLAFE